MLLGGREPDADTVALAQLAGLVRDAGNVALAQLAVRESWRRRKSSLSITGFLSPGTNFTTCTTTLPTNACLK